MDGAAHCSDQGEPFDAATKATTQVGLRTLAVNNGTGVAEPTADYHIDASDVDIDRLFEEAGRAFSHGLQMEYWRAHADRDALDVKVEAIVLARNAAEMAVLESKAEAAFDSLYDQHKKAIYKLKEQRRASITRSCGWRRPSPTKCRGICQHPSTSSARLPIRFGSATCT